MMPVYRFVLLTLIHLNLVHLNLIQIIQKDDDQLVEEVRYNDHFS